MTAPPRPPTRSKKKILPPSLPAPDELERWTEAQLVEAEIYSRLSANQLNLANQSVKRVQFDEAEFHHSDLNGINLPSFKMRDVRFTQCDLANAIWQGAQISRVEMMECRLVGLTITEAKLRDCVFVKCNGSYIRSRFASWKAARFEECDLRDSDFHGADLSGVDFMRCDLRNALLTGAKLKGASLRGSNIEGISVYAKDLDGVSVDPMQAAYLAPLFGLKVVW